MQRVRHSVVMKACMHMYITEFVFLLYRLHTVVEHVIDKMYVSSNTIY